MVVGTSLTVYPFASLPQEVPETVLRALINKEPVGDFKAYPREKDIIFHGEADLAAELLAEEMGWLPELQALATEQQETKASEQVDKIVSDLEKLNLDKKTSKE